jgi:mono/diheme cytochrome c family protein
LPRFVRWLLGVLGVLVFLVAVLIAGVYLSASRKLNERFGNPVASIQVDRSPQRIARGQHLVSSMPGCAACHSSNPQADPPILDGAYMTDLAPLGNFYPPNLTPGGPLKDWTDGQIIRAIREGMDKDGRPLAVMPSEDYHSMSDGDVQAIVAYLRSQPAVEKQTPPVSLSFLGTVLLGTGQVPLSNQAPVSNVPDVPVGTTRAYGEYLVRITGCRGCHGPNLDGTNVPPGPPPGPSLKLIQGWTQEQFNRTMREGVDPSGHALDPELMPWRQVGRGTDDDLRALFEYLRSV